MTSLNEYREMFRGYAKNVKGEGPGFYSLVLPTGGGKTLTGLTLACNLGGENFKCVYVCPRNSILEQTKGIYQKICGKENVLTHYGYPEFISDREERNFTKMDTMLWNRPVVLTSYVQFFESLFHCKVPKLLKFYELYGRVIIIDEIQLMSPEILNPTLKALEYLVDVLKCSIILMSATPPDFSKTIIKDRVIQTIGTREDIEGFCSLANNVKIRYIRYSDETIFDRVQDEISRTLPNSVLYVSNTIEQAKNVFDFFRESYSDYKVLCLTTYNSVQHRKDILRDVENLLNSKEKLILVSTSIVEAGVDVDFDMGFREITNLNSIVQCAGRVKRNRRDESGDLFVLHCDDTSVIPKCVGSRGSEIQTTLRFLEEDTVDITKYNREIANFAQYDKSSVMLDMKNPNTPYSEIAKKMKIINNVSTALFLRNYNKESQELFDKAVNGEPFNVGRYMEYVVNVMPVSKFEHRRWTIKGSEKEIYTYEGVYDSRKGVVRY